MSTADDQPYAAIHASLDAAAGSRDPAEALPHLRSAADGLTGLIDETMARAVVGGRGSLRSVGAGAGLSENAVGPRLGRTPLLAPYANESGRVTAAGVERARYDQETGRPPEPAPDDADNADNADNADSPATRPRPPMRFRPRRTT